MQPRYVCSLKMGYSSFSCGWMEIRFNIASYITVYVTYKSGCWNVFHDNLHFHSQPVFLQTLLVMWTLELSDDVYYLTEHVFFKLWLKMLDFILLSYQRGFWKSGFAALDMHIMSYYLYMFLHIQTKKQTNSMVWVRERTTPTERPPLVGEVIANFCG
jgi:hypothetical protein